PPLRPHRDWIVPVALAVLAVGFICLWWVTPNPATRGAAPATESTAPAVTPKSVTPTTAVDPRLDVTHPSAVAPAIAAESANGREPGSLPAKSDVPSAATADATGAAPPKGSTAAPPSKSPRHPKVSRDPWLE